MKHAQCKIFLTGLLALCLILPACKEEKRRTQSEQPLNISPIKAYVTMLRTSFLVAVKENSLNGLDVLKVSFAIPESRGFNTNPPYEIYNPVNSWSVKTIDQESYQSYWANYVDEYPVFIPALGNRVAGQGTDKPDVILVLPHVKETTCKLLNVSKGQRIDEVDILTLRKINLIDFSTEVLEEKIQELPSEAACIKTSDGYFYYQLLYAM